MKRTLTAILFFTSVMLLPAQDSDPLASPRRTAEWGFGLGLGVANSFLGLNDIFTGDKMVKISLDEFAARSFDIGANTEMEFFIALNPGGGFSFRLFYGVESLFYSTLSRDITQLIGLGNAEDLYFEGGGVLGLSVFAGGGLRGTARIGGWTFSLAPAFFVPIAYAEKQELTVTYESETAIKARAATDIYLHTLVPLVDENSKLMPANPGFEGDMAWGMDMSLGAEYALFPWLDVGGSIRNCPLFPARMENDTLISMNFGFDMGDESLVDAAAGGNFDLGDKISGPDFAYTPGRETRIVFRPLSFEVHAWYKPVSNNWVRIALKPSLGFSVLTIYGEACFNWALDGRIDLTKFFALTLGSSLREKIWKQSLSLEFNMKLLQLDVGIALQSQDFVGSFYARGIHAAVGLRAGW